jgi:2-polyprenyl-3-methyl-5-hydroxy-6-metoxy-1,4-benzoquinol methylase
MERRVCPGCGHPLFKVLGGRGAAFDTPVGESNFRQPEYDVRECNQCGLYYKSHILNDEELSKYYQQVDFSKWDIGTLFPSEVALLEVLAQLPTGSRILDYGCSTGRLLSHLTNGYGRFGVEANQDAAYIATSKGITMLSDTDLAEASQPFNAIVLSDVFEHLLEPTKTLRGLCKSLSDSGLLILSTGNSMAKACQQDIASFWYFRTPEHLCMFNQKNADYLARELNLRLLEWKELSHYDFNLTERLRQHAQNFAYWKFHGSPDAFWTSILKFTPGMKKARNWPVPPALTCTKDHVLAVFQKRAK